METKTILAANRIGTAKYFDRYFAGICNNLLFPEPMPDKAHVLLLKMNVTKICSYSNLVDSSTGGPMLFQGRIAPPLSRRPHACESNRLAPRPHSARSAKALPAPLGGAKKDGTKGSQTGGLCTFFPFSIS